MLRLMNVSSTFCLRYVEYEPEINKPFSLSPQVFPRVTKCKFWKYGPSGTVQKHDALCVLALNIINEKIYVMLWFWLIILSILSGWVDGVVRALVSDTWCLVRG